MDPKLELQELKAFLAIPENEKFFDAECVQRYIKLELLIEADNQRINEIQLFSKIKLEELKDINKVEIEIQRIKGDESIGQVYPWSKVEQKLESDKQKELLIKRKHLVLIYLFLRFLILFLDPMIKQLTSDPIFTFELILERDFKLEALIIENYLSFNLFELNIY